MERGSWDQDEPAPELLPLDEGSGVCLYIRRGCSAIFCGLSCSRLFNYGVFFCVCMASLLGQVAPVVVALLDTPVLVALYLLCGMPSNENYKFSTSLFDVVMLSVLRTLTLMVAYLVLGERQNCHKPYLWATHLSLLLTLAFIFAKVVEYKYNSPRSDETWAAVLMFLVSSVAALGHSLVAASIYASARKRRRALLTCGRRGPTERDWLMGAEAAQREGYASTSRAHSPPFSARSKHGGADEDGEDSDDESPDVPAKAYVDAESRFITCEGVEVHYKVAGGSLGSGTLPAGDLGPGDAAAIMLHGFGGGAFSWRLVAAAVAAKTHTRCVMLDRPGFGLTERPDRSDFPEDANPYAITTQVKIVLSLCEKLGLRRVVLVGHADGCLLALLTAAYLMQTPAAVNVCGLVMITPNLTVETVPTSTRLLLQTKLGRQMLRPLLRSEIGEVAIRRAWYDLSKLSREVLELYKTPLRVEGWDRALHEVARRKKDVDVADVDTLFAVVAGLPAAVISGENDRVVSCNRAASIAAKLPGCLSRMVPACGHLPHEEAPAAVVLLLSKFLSDHVGVLLASVPEQPNVSGDDCDAA